MSALADALIHALQEYHRSTSDLPGMGGELKDSPADFQVEEVMPYSPCGEGEHTYITVRRSGLTTPEVGRIISKTLGCPMREIGWAGLKDKHAVTTQTFSAKLGWHASPEQVANDLAEVPELEILNVSKHQNKIKRGHVKVNRFRLIVRNVVPGALENGLAIAEAIRVRGVPNYFGDQRFSRNYRNIESACKILDGQRVANRKDIFMVSVLQGALFNIWLNRRLVDGLYSTILHGDIAQKCDSGGLFDVSDVSQDQRRFDDKEIVYTGPIYGYSMRQAGSESGEREDSVFQEFGLEYDQFRQLKAKGTRRAGVIYPETLEIDESDDGVRVSFSLPSGCYATTVMREFME